MTDQAIFLILSVACVLAFIPALLFIRTAVKLKRENERLREVCARNAANVFTAARAFERFNQKGSAFAMRTVGNELQDNITKE